MSYTIEAKFLVRSIIVLILTISAIASILGIIAGIINLALSDPITIITCILAGYVLAVIGTRVLYPARE